MLVLSRKPGERICIGGDIIVTVTEVRGDRVRLGFEAPSSVAIHRQELRSQRRRRAPVEVPCVETAEHATQFV